ncbi:hypothetical protein AB5I41_10985 [Sphingomonas sp. MMS24-JH45]
MLAYVYGNAPRLKAQGVQVDVFGSPLPGLTLNVGAIYNDARYGSSYNIACYQMQTAAQGCVKGNTSTAGNQLAGAPEWKVTATSNMRPRSRAAWTPSLHRRRRRVHFADLFVRDQRSRPDHPGGGDLLGPDRGAHRRSALGLSLFGRNLFDTYRRSSSSPRRWPRSSLTRAPIRRRRPRTGAA